MLSYSGMQMMDEADRRGLLDDIETFIRTDFGGRVTRPGVVTLTTATSRNAAFTAVSINGHDHRLGLLPPATQMSPGARRGGLQTSDDPCGS